ncbi:MAG TPA: ABC transporter permease [Candidatus Blautia excrementigallinarum]|nr:ABC transporter permease [Candidatus Blautia excrementigallinarum]
MNTIHLNKIIAIADVKTRAFCGKNCIIMPIFSVLFTLMFRFLYQYVMGDGKLTPQLGAYVLSMGLVVNIGAALYCTSFLLAEEKEKKTLRVLMTSSVNALEFFIGSILPVFLATVLINYVLIPTSGYEIPGNALPIFSAVTILASLTSCILGMLLGIFAKDQVSTSTVTTPLLLILMLIPMFSDLVEVLDSIAKYIFTGAVMNMVANIAAKEKPYLDNSSLLVMVVETILAIALFIFFYRRNGYEKD